MKKLTLTFSILCAFAAFAFAGETYSGKDKEVMQQAPPPCDWYRAHEWDLDLWGAFAFPGNTGRDERPIGGFVNGLAFSGVASSSNDRFIDRDDSWAGGLDVKYFCSKYWGFGVEAMVVDCNINAGGAGLATFTLRYPIRCSRFAPYAWVGGGITGGGGHHDEEHGFIGGLALVHFDQTTDIENKHYEATAQFGTGMEMRITRRIGLMSDFAWNVVSGPDNNFGMTRFGLTLSY